MTDLLPFSDSIHKYGSCSNECFVLALIYIDRLIQRSNFFLTDLNVHRVVITAILLAAKFFDDAYYNNAYYAKVGGVLVSEMNGLEVDFLFRINFSLHVTTDLFNKYCEELVAHSNGPCATVQQESTHVPVAPVIRQLAFPSQCCGMRTSEVNTFHHGVSQQRNEQYSNGSERQYITPSPPESSAMAASAHRNGVEIMASVPSGGLYSSMQSSPEIATRPSDISNQYMQLANSIPSLAAYPNPIPQHWICSPQPLYNGASTVQSIPLHIHGEQYVVYDKLGYPYGTTLVHHNHAVTVDTGISHDAHQQKGYSHQQHHTDPMYMAPVSEASQQYFMSGHLLTGTSST